MVVLIAGRLGGKLIAEKPATDKNLQVFKLK